MTMCQSVQKITGSLQMLCSVTGTMSAGMERYDRMTVICVGIFLFCRCMKSFVLMVWCLTRQAPPMLNVVSPSVLTVQAEMSDSQHNPPQAVHTNTDTFLSRMKQSVTSLIFVLMGCQIQSHALVG